MSGYKIEKLAERLWILEDEYEDSLYLVEGQQKALVIDTGMGKSPLLPVLHQLTDKPIELALTHGHVDHMLHAEEFEEIYLHMGDRDHWEKLFPKREFKPIRNGDILDLGDLRLTVIEATGHTQGSVVFVDQKHRIIFTGDAIGSGDEATLWLPDSDDVSVFEKHLRQLEKALQPYAEYIFWGGHRRQANRTGAAWPDMQNIRDMQELCRQMLAGEAYSEDYILDPVFNVDPEVQEKIRGYRYGKALMVQRNDKIC